MHTNKILVFSLILVLLLSACTASTTEPAAEPTATVAQPEAPATEEQAPEEAVAEEGTAEESVTEETTAEEDTTAENVALVQEASLVIWGEGDVDAIDTYYADDYVSASMAPGETFDKEAMKQDAAESIAVFADHTVEVEEIFGEGDLVAARYAISGTPVAELNAPVDEVLVRGIVIAQVEDGQIVREWDAFDTASMMTQLGFVPAMTEDAPADEIGTTAEPAPTTPEQQDANRQAAQRISEELWGGNNSDLIDAVYAEDFVYHNPGFGATPDAAGVLQDLSLLHSGLSEVNATVEATVVADNRVAVAWTVTGVHTGEVMGIPVSGNDITYRGVSVFHFNEAGQITDEWSIGDNLGLMEQMGAMGAESAPSEEPSAEETTAAAVDAAGELPTVTFTATEYAYSAPDSVPAGPTRLAIANEGQAPHDISVLKLGEGRTIEDVMGVFQVMASGEEAPIPEWVTFYGGAVAGPGQTASYVVDLTPGNYVVYSFGMDEQGVPDAAKGMIQPLTVTEAESDSTTTLPEADISVELVDYQYVIQGDFTAGEQVVKVTNTGMEPHEMIMFRLAEDTGLENFMNFMQSEEPAGPPPFTPAGGAPPISDGIETYHSFMLEPGNYVLICFLPSPTNQGMPHLMLGMVRELIIE